MPKYFFNINNIIINIKGYIFCITSNNEYFFFIKHEMFNYK